MLCVQGEDCPESLSATQIARQRVREQFWSSLHALVRSPRSSLVTSLRNLKHATRVTGAESIPPITCRPRVRCNHMVPAIPTVHLDCYPSTPSDTGFGEETRSAARHRCLPTAWHRPTFCAHACAHRMAPTLAPLHMSSMIIGEQCAYVSTLPNGFMLLWATPPLEYMLKEPKWPRDLALTVSCRTDIEIEAHQHRV